MTNTKKKTASQKAATRVVVSRLDPTRVPAPERRSGVIAPVREIVPLVERVVAILEEARSGVVRTVNSAMVIAYWHVGREIVEFVQRGAKRAEYGEQILEGALRLPTGAHRSRLLDQKSAKLSQFLPSLFGPSSSDPEGVR